MYKITVLQFCKAKQTRSPTLSFLDVDLWHSSGFKESKYIYIFFYFSYIFLKSLPSVSYYFLSLTMSCSTVTVKPSSIFCPLENPVWV